MILFFLSSTIFSQFEFDGQLLGQTSLGLEKQSSKFIGARYLPSLNFKKKTDSLSSFAIQIWGNFSATQFLTPEKKNESSSNIDPYRIWLRYQVKNWEFRAGLKN